MAIERAPTVTINTEKCVCCGDCSYICPVSVFTVTTPPCQKECPLGTDVATYISLIAQGKFHEALASIKQINPFPGIVCRICTHKCETQCLRGKIDEPLAIRLLKRAAVEFGSTISQPQPHFPVDACKVAIVGSGPAGIMAAHDLAIQEFEVTIFEALPIAGGMLSFGIPRYRLPQEVVEEEISQIKTLGVEIKLNSAIGKKTTITDLFNQNYKAILLAIGAHHSLSLNIPGEKQFQGVQDAISFLREVNLGHSRLLAKKAVVVGGGNAAVDSARTLLRLGCQDVSIIYRRTRTEMPAIESEIQSAIQEGIKINYLVNPVKVFGQDGYVTGLCCEKMKLGEPDSSGQRAPLPVPGTEFVIQTDLIIIAIGQQANMSLQENYGKLFNSKHLISVDSETMATNILGVFAAGDVVTGPSSVIEALASGRKAASYISRYIRGEKLNQSVGHELISRTSNETKNWWMEIQNNQRKKPPELPVEIRKTNFNEVGLGLTKESAVNEAQRCLGCAVFTDIDLAICCGNSCRSCQYGCWKGAISIQ